MILCSRWTFVAIIVLIRRAFAGLERKGRMDGRCSRFLSAQYGLVVLAIVDFLGKFHQPEILTVVLFDDVIGRDGVLLRRLQLFQALNVTCADSVLQNLDLLSRQRLAVGFVNSTIPIIHNNRIGSILVNGCHT
eukprot:Lithocolla_globosa_v1_NODE_935_length_3062_cov_11.623545.p2 type:complete len:134 gc:universal NODE_935_length_3062_cov_11.623545:1827-2228(+)